MTYRHSVAAIFVTLAMGLSVPASAKTPPEVLKAYKDYTASMQKGDYKSAIAHAKTAWKKAEDTLGDHAMTGDLAYNYGYAEKNQGDKSKAIKALERSIELSSLKSTDALALRLEREVELVSSMDGVTSDTRLGKRIEKVLKFAKSNNMSQTVFVGELYVHDANICTRRIQRKMKNPRKQIGSLVNTGSTKKGIKEGQKECSKIARKSVEIFESNPSDTRPVYVATAHNYVGYGYETSKNWLAAAMSYQKARNAIEGVYGRENSLVASTIGRWMNARNFLERTDKLEFAESQGLCKCWPFTDTRKTVPYISWVEADFPAKALTRSSGYAIIQLDVSDDGKPENVRILNSWPDDVYDKSSLTAAKQLQFPPKTGDEPENYRKGITIPYSYYLRLGLEPI